MKGMAEYLRRMMTILLSGAMVLTAVPQTVYADVIDEDVDLESIPYTDSVMPISAQDAIPNKATIRFGTELHDDNTEGLLIEDQQQRIIHPDNIDLNEFEDETADKTFRGEDFWVDNCGYRILSEDTVSFANGLRLKTAKVTIPSKVTYNGKEYTVTSIGGAAFSYGTTEHLIGSEENRDNTWLEEVIMPDTVIEIEGKIFYEYVYYGTFVNCVNLSKVKLSNSLQFINTLAFGNCIKLEHIDFPDSILVINPASFSGTGLTSVSIPEKCYWVAGFRNASHLKEINVNKNNKDYYSIDGVLFYSHYTPPGSSKEYYNVLAEYPEGKENEVYYVPEGTKALDPGCFADNYKVKKVVLPKTLEEDSMFLGQMLDGTLEVSPTFYMSSIEEISISDDNEFYTSKDGILYSKNFKTLLEYPPAKKDKIFFVPDSVEIIGSFNENKLLEELYIPLNVNCISYSGIWNMRNMKKLVFTKNSPLNRVSRLVLNNSSMESFCVPANIKNFEGLQTFEGDKLRQVYFAKGAEWHAVETKDLACNFSSRCDVKVYGHGTDNGLPELINEVKKEKPSIEYIDVETNEVPLLGITFDDTIVKLDRGEEKNIAVCEYPYWMDDVELKYETSDPSIATVDNLGNVKAIEYGECYITVTALDGSGEYSRCKIEVKEEKNASPISEIQINETKVELSKEATTVLNAIVSPVDADPNKIIWTSSDDSIVKVNSDLTSIKDNSIDVILTAGNKEGTATITASAGDVTATVKVTVVNPVKFDKHEITLVSLPGSKDTITATVKGRGYSADTLVWSSSDENVATVVNGVVTAAEGLKETSTATITAQTPDGKYKDTCLVTVTATEQVKAPVASINAGKVDIGTIVTFTCETTGAEIYCTLDGTVPSFDTLGNPAGTTMLYTGGMKITEDTLIKAIAVKEGYKDSDIVEYNYTVEKTPDPVDPEDPEEPETGKVTLDVVIVEGGKILNSNLAKAKEDGKTYMITLGDKKIATVNNKGQIQGKKAGTTTATVTKKDVEYKLNITVVKAGFTAKSYRVNTGDKIMSAFNSGGVEITSYNSSKPDIAQVYPTTDGLYVVALKKGSSKITAVCNGKKYTATVNVYDPYINGVNTLLLNNKTATLSVKNGYGKTTWATDNSNVVTVKNGKIKGVSKGTATITAINNGRTMTKVIKVYTVPKFAQKGYETKVGTPIDVVLTRDEDYGDPTYSVSNKKLASIDENGRLTPVKNGTVTVTAMLDGRKYTTKVKIKK